MTNPTAKDAFLFRKVEIDGKEELIQIPYGTKFDHKKKYKRKAFEKQRKAKKLGLISRPVRKYDPKKKTLRH